MNHHSNGWITLHGYSHNTYTIRKKCLFKLHELKKLTERLSENDSHQTTNDSLIPPTCQIKPTKKIKDILLNNAGHRTRLKEKFLNSSFAGFHDYEIIELILFQAIPRRDTKPIAKLLLKTFNTLEAVFSASKEDILKIKGCGETVHYTLKLFSETSLMLSRKQLNNAPLLSKWSELEAYLRLKIGYLTHEEFHILFLNAKSYLINDLKIFRGTTNKATIYPREILKHALECGAVAIILAHNHPSGDATPSSEDIKLTYQIIKAAEIIDIQVIDHIIIGKYDIQSFKNLNLL
jgi:DNA repair protein RadC